MTVGTAQPRTVILTPCGEKVDYEHYRCIQNVKRFGVPVIQLHGVTCIDIARAILATQGLETGADVLLWIDSDILFDVSAVLSVSRWCVEGPYAILGAAYSARSRGNGLAVSFPADTKSVQFYVPGLYPAHAVGMGFTAVRAEVFATLAKGMEKVGVGNPKADIKVWPFFLPMVVDGSYLAEDWAFCYRAVDAGFKIGVDTEPRILHKGSHKFTIEDGVTPVAPDEPLEVKFGGST
jgi:hypothetical protein